MSEKKKSCQHDGGYKMLEGELVCVLCGEPSESKRWRNNVFGSGAKAVARGETEDKSVSPPTTK
jgi:hypothetical protein